MAFPLVLRERVRSRFDPGLKFTLFQVRIEFQCDNERPSLLLSPLPGRVQLDHNRVQKGLY